MISFEAIINNLKETIILFDKKHSIMFINKSGEELFGKSSKDVFGKTFSQLAFGEKKISLLIKKTVSDGRSFRGKSVSIMKEDQLNIDFNLSPCYLQDKIEGAVLSISENIAVSDRDDYDYEPLVYMLGSIAHEIKNPLGGIKGAAQLLRSRQRDEDIGEYIDLIIKETDRLNSILLDYLTICKKPSFHPVNIHEIIEKAIDLLIIEIEKKEIVLKRFYDPSLPQILGEESKLLQVFLNLIKNAVESMKKGGRLDLSTRASKELFVEHGKAKRMALISIKDTGRGITEEELQKIFIPFYTKKKSGTGIGLALSKKVIKDHGGSIRVKSIKGKGTTFFTYLPYEING